jgi:L-asparaginase II
LLAASVRSGLVETTHEGAVAVVSPDGAVLASFGDIDRPFYLRSSAKPFQAAVSQEAGAGLDVLELAMAAASHRGYPVHIALVESMLDRAGLSESSLRCPHDWPLAPGAARLVASTGATSPRRVWHNCSGKHAGFLRACASRGWPLDSYLSPEHPLQMRVIELVTELGELPVQPVGVDGCGAPVMRTTARAMALLFARLATETSLAPVFAAMHRYPALVSGNGEGDTEIAIALDAVAKGGAAGCVGVSLAGRLGVAAKSWDGLGTVANLAAASALEQLEVLSPTAVRSLESVLAPEVSGGGKPVGSLEARFRLEVT